MQQDSWEMRWESVEQIGAGGQGTTHLVRAKDGSGNQAVLKRLNKGKDATARERMAHEAINLQTINRLDPFIAPRFFESNAAAYFRDPTIELYLLMEYVKGETLDKIVKAHDGRLSLDKAAEIIRPIANAIELMHQYEILHRDLKPANLMVRNFAANDIVLLDFGLSFDRSADQSTVTRTGETIKNELIAPPEATAKYGNRRDHRMDILNVVALFLYCLTGELVGGWRDEHDRPQHRWKGRLAKDVIGDDPRGEQLWFFFDTGLAADIDSRFQTIPELLSRLERVVNPSRTPRNLRELDKELGADLRRRDRRLKLSDYVPVVVRLNEEIANYVSSVLNDCSTFVLQPVGYPDNLPPPPNLDPVRRLPLSYHVQIKTRPDTWVVHFYLSAKGDRCVLSYAVVFTDVERSRMMAIPFGQQPELRWQEIEWFDPAQLPARATIRAWVDEAIGDVMEKAASIQSSALAR